MLVKRLANAAIGDRNITQAGTPQPAMRRNDQPPSLSPLFSHCAAVVMRSLYFTPFTVQ